MNQKKSREIFDWIKSLLIAIILALLIRSFVIEIFLVEGQSMYPTLEHSQRLVVNKFLYRFSEPEREDVVVFEYDADKDFIKRIVGLPGDTIVIDDGQVFVNGEPIDEDYRVKKVNDTYGPEEVPADKYFVLGDNRDNSMDSRSSSVGFIHEDEIKGRAFFVFWPLEQMGSL